MLETAQYLRQTIQFFVPLLEALSEPEVSQKPLPHKWSKKEIIGHLIDSACNNQQKFTRMMTQSHLDFVGYNQDVWVQNQAYQAYSWPELIRFWAAFNGHIAHIIEHSKPTDLQNTITIEGNGLYTLEFIMKDYVEHIKHHLKAVLPTIAIGSAFQNVYGA